MSDWMTPEEWVACGLWVLILAITAYNWFFGSKDDL